MRNYLSRRNNDLGFNFFEDAFVGLTAIVLIVEIIGSIGNVKNGIFAIANRLMHMQIQAYCAHISKNPYASWLYYKSLDIFWQLGSKKSCGIPGQHFVAK